MMSNEAKESKKKKLTTAAAVLLAAVMLLGGGTFAYLWDDTSDVTNTFATNEVLVDLYEHDTDGEKVTERNDYNIIPGTSEDKDPTVEVTATVPAYVFVEVTDNTDGLVDYYIESGWTLLTSSKDDNGVTTYVYYREYDPDDEDDDGVYSVLQGDKVYYDKDLVNEKMQNEDGTLKEDITLSFTALAIQKSPFTDAATAYGVLKGEITAVSDEETLEDALNSDAYVFLSDDVTTDGITVSAGADAVLYLGTDVTLTCDEEYSAAILVEDGATLTVVGGTIDATAQQSDAVKNEGGTVTLENVTLTRSNENGIKNVGGDNTCYVIDNHTGTMVLNDCTATATSSESSLINNGANSSNEDPNNLYSGTADLTINGGTYSNGYVTVKNSWGGTLTINGGTFASTADATLLNWNVATINDGDFSTTKSCSVIMDTYDTGREDAVGKLTVNGGTYTYPTNCYMIDHSVNGVTGDYCTDKADCAHITINNAADITMSNDYFYYNGSSSVTK